MSKSRLWLAGTQVMVDPSVWHRTDADIGRPATHALVIGTSWYDNLPEDPLLTGPLGLSQLDCAAMAAYSIASWLKAEYHNLEAPLATIRLLLSPSPSEIAGPEEPGTRQRRHHDLHSGQRQDRAAGMAKRLRHGPGKCCAAVWLWARRVRSTGRALRAVERRVSTR